MVAHSLTLGGIERHVVALSAALAREGHTVALAAPREGWMAQTMAAAGHVVCDLPMRGMYDAPSAWRLRRFARDWRADVIHGHAQRGARYARWAAQGWLPRGPAPRMLATAHSTNAFKWFGPDHPVIAVSGAVRDFLLAKGLAEDQVRLVYLGIPDPGRAVRVTSGPLWQLSATSTGAAPGRTSVTAGLPPLDPQTGPTPAAPFTAGMLARLERVKGHDIALDAAALLKDRLPLRLIFTGDDTTPWAAEMKARAQTLGVAVDFQGQRTDLPAILGQFDALLAPSRREALSLTLIEAAAAGVPAIGANVGGIPEVIADGTSGLLVPPGNAEALAAAILRLARDPALRARMAAAGRTIYEARFTEAAMVEGTLACYRSVMEDG